MNQFNSISRPILVIPSYADLGMTCDLTEDVFLDSDTNSSNLKGNSKYVYSRIYDVKFTDGYNITYESSDLSAIDSEVVIEDSQNDSLSGIWIDPIESPNASNFYDAANILYTENHITNNFTLQTHNTYITQNVFKFNDSSNFTFDDYKVRRVPEPDENVIIDSESFINFNLYEDDEFECGVFLSQLSEEILNEERVKEDRQVLSENSALKQLIAADRRSIKQRKAVLLIGDDSNNAHTVHSISVVDPNLECLGDVASEVVIDKTAKANKRKKIYQCNKCKQIFEHITAFRQHIRSDHKPYNYNLRSDCETSKACKSINDKVKESTVYFMCTQCNKNFKVFLFYCYLHTYITSRQFPCGVGTSNRAPFRLILTHLTCFFDIHNSCHARSSPCEICSKNFNRISDLKRHLIEHIVKSTMAKAPVNRNGTLHIECIVCNKAVFSKVDRYKAHLREHAKLTLYQCTLCDKSFSDSSNFSKHKKIHAAKYYQCDTCLKKFQTKKMITKHMDYHNNNPPESCDICGKLLYSNSLFKKHMKNHKGVRTTMQQCSFCPEYFNSSKYKLDHEWNVHKCFVSALKEVAKDGCLLNN
ncbi:hypothetical protein K1T71_008480 [Dendrolimus kikuchii]|uniref:Uncharacterized protein n=1 Tax=Dendrolimus kikuchii TaxID=765133 RepID=A0ACC1CXI1_9NEOP|nr:hypothetical protein K1T71_008480 [Dendrolimus kikuchii]